MKNSAHEQLVKLQRYRLRRQQLEQLLQDAAAEIPPDDSEEEEIEPEKESKYLDLSGWSMIDILDAYNSEPERISPEMHSRIERLLRVRREGELSSEGWMGK